MFLENIQQIDKRLQEWNNKSEEEASIIAEENGWDWYFDWFDVGDTLRYKYEQADTDPQVANKYGRYDRFYDKHRTESSSVFLGVDGSFHELDRPIRKWTVYADCTKYECPYNKGENEKGHHRCSYFYDNTRMPDCFNDLFASLQSIKDITGDLEVVKKHSNIHKDIIGWFEQGDEYFKNKGDDSMAKPFWVALSELKIEDDISVYWDDGTMYINDESDGQATAQVSLFQSYKFAVLINASNFDYTASDKEVEKLSEELLDLIDEDFYAINIWNYIDDISSDFYKLTKRWLTIDDKRHIVCAMTEMGDGYDLTCGFGSASVIAKMLWDYIKGNEKANIPKTNNIIINRLADKYLQTDTYDIMKFAEELHKYVNFDTSIEINGSLWVNSAKYEYVDKIIINNDDVEIYYKDKQIGCIARENIVTLVEQNYEENIMTDLIDNLIHLFDIRKVGDF